MVMVVVMAIWCNMRCTDDDAGWTEWSPVMTNQWIGPLEAAIQSSEGFDCRKAAVRLSISCRCARDHRLPGGILPEDRYCSLSKVDPTVMTCLDVRSDGSRL